MAMSFLIGLCNGLGVGFFAGLIYVAWSEGRFDR
jgi:hypothetical protein